MNKKVSVKFFGHTESAQGIEADPDEISAILNMLPPTNISTLRTFLGMTNQIAKFVPNLADISKPLRECYKRTMTGLGIPVKWNHFQN